MRPIIPFITIQAIYLSALMRVLFRFASSTEQGIKLTKEKREKKKSAACVRLLQITYYLLLFIYPSIYYWNFGVLGTNFTIISQLAACVIKLVHANTFCKLFVQPFRLVSFCTFV